jgi:hypothetical protein
MVLMNILTNFDDHWSFRFRGDTFLVKKMTSSDLFLTFDLVVMINLFSLLVKLHHMQQTRLKSEHVLNVDPVLKKSSTLDQEVNFSDLSSGGPKGTSDQVRSTSV